mmetsp:Transcript_10055/g.19201  ORF Transcript_10055/g.19201 Transcript_10055/m.19201 type:complete len:123 (+) Transcript_10055:221-589(+)
MMPSMTTSVPARFLTESARATVASSLVASSMPSSSFPKRLRSWEASALGGMVHETIGFSHRTKRKGQGTFDKSTVDNFNRRWVCAVKKGDYHRHAAPADGQEQPSHQTEEVAKKKQTTRRKT